MDTRLAPRHFPRRSCLGTLALAVFSLSASACSDLTTEPAAGPPSAPATRAIAEAFVARLGCSYGTLPAGAKFEVCVPSTWNGGVVFWAHGYVAAGEPLEVPDDEAGGIAVADIVRALGYIYASTSYRDNGLIAADAVQDLEQLAALLQAAHPALAAAPAYLVGASEGGLATALALQNPATPFDGGLAMCGPIGSFAGQTNYFGDFRLVFDYFFPGVLAGDPIDQGDLLALQPDWETVWSPAIRAAIASDLAKGGSRTSQLFAVTRVPFDSADPAQTTIDVLWYNAFGTPDAITKLGGLPFNNVGRRYVGSLNDAGLNASVPRIAGSPDPLELARYETTGAIERPMVTLHTTRDQLIPYAHETLYLVKAYYKGDVGQLVPIPTDRYGHCNFTIPEVLTAFAALAWRVSSSQLQVASTLFRDQRQAAEFASMAHGRGMRPSITADERPLRE